MGEELPTFHAELSKLDIVHIRSELLAMRTALQARGGERDLLQLKQVEAALGKMARGRYGACDSCSRPVAKARLLAAPQARYCAACSGRATPARRGAAIP